MRPKAWAFWHIQVLESDLGSRGYAVEMEIALADTIGTMSTVFPGVTSMPPRGGMRCGRTGAPQRT